MIFNGKVKSINYFSSGGIGDALLTTPLFDVLKKRFPNCKIKVLCINKLHRDIFLHNPNIDVLKVFSFKDAPFEVLFRFFAKRRFKKKYKNNFYGMFAPSKSYKIKASQIIGQMIDIDIPNSLNLEIYLTEDEEKRALKLISSYSNPIGIHITSSSSANQNWTNSNWEQLICSMPDNTFIQFGLKDEDKILGAIDMRGVLTIRETIAVMKHLATFVAIDSSLANATNAVNLAGVVLYGPSNPEIWGHSNNINLYKNLSCAPCIDILENSVCPYGRSCMTLISTNEVKDAIVLQLASKKINNQI